MKKHALPLAAIALLLVAAAGSAAAPPAFSLGWYGGDVCDDALAANPGAPGDCRYGAREADCADAVDNDSDERTDCLDSDCLVPGSAGARQCLAACVAETETCGDGVDQDCDGEDEPCGCAWWDVACQLGAPVCGDGSCASGETCAADCDPVRCGDGLCGGGETCDSCSGDCGACPGAPGSASCGNGNCETGETCASCQADCGTCGGIPPETCGDTGACNAGGVGPCEYDSCRPATGEPTNCQDSTACNFGAAEICEYDLCRRGYDVCGDGQRTGGEECEGPVDHGTCENCALRCDSGYSPSKTLNPFDGGKRVCSEWVVNEKICGDNPGSCPNADYPIDSSYQPPAGEQDSWKCGSQICRYNNTGTGSTQF